MVKKFSRPKLSDISADILALRFGTSNGQWSAYPVHTIKQLAYLTGYSTAAISAHIKEALKQKRINSQPQNHADADPCPFDQELDTAEKIQILD